MQVRDLLTFYKFPGATTPIIRGSALCAVSGERPELGRDSILKLMDAIDKTIVVRAHAGGGGTGLARHAVPRWWRRRALLVQQQRRRRQASV